MAYENSLTKNNKSYKLQNISTYIHFNEISEKISEQDL